MLCFTGTVKYSDCTFIMQCSNYTMAEFRWENKSLACDPEQCTLYQAASLDRLTSKLFLTLMLLRVKKLREWRLERH